MKIGSLFLIVTAFCFLAGYLYVNAQESEEDVKVFENNLDLAVPDSPLFTIFGITNQEVNRPSTPRELVTDIFNGITPQGNFETGLALEFVPFSLLGGLNNMNVLEYEKNLLAQIFSRTSLSFATAKGVTDNEQALRLGLGLRSTIFDKGDPRLDRTLSQCYVNAFNKTQDLRRPLQSLSLETPIFEFVHDACDDNGDLKNKFELLCKFQKVGPHDKRLRQTACEYEKNIDENIYKLSCSDRPGSREIFKKECTQLFVRLSRPETDTNAINLTEYLNLNETNTLNNKDKSLLPLCNFHKEHGDEIFNQLCEFPNNFLASEDDDTVIAKNAFCTTEVSNEQLDTVCKRFDEKQDCNLVAKPIVDQEAILSQPALTSLDTKLSELQKQCRDEAKARNWNRTAWVVGAAPTWISDDGETDNLEWNGIGLWTSLAYGFDTAPFVPHDYYKLYGTDKEDEIPWLTKYSQIIFGFRYRNDEQVEVPEESKDAEMMSEMSTMEMMQEMEKKFTQRETFFMGSKLILGVPNIALLLEGGYTFVDLDEGKADDIFQASIGTNFRLTNDLWLELAGGYNTEDDDDEISFLSSLKWALQRKQTLGVSQ